MDTQYTVGVAGGVPVTFISVGPNNNDGIDGFLDIINFLIKEASQPQVLSTSYGFDEPGIPTSIAKYDLLIVFKVATNGSKPALYVTRICSLVLGVHPSSSRQATAAFRVPSHSLAPHLSPPSPRDVLS